MLSKRLIIPSLVISQLLTAIPVLITSLLLIEISQSYAVEVGVVGQVRTVASAVSVVTGLAMAGMSVKYSQKAILVAGVGLMCVSAISSSAAPTLWLLLAAFAVFGIGRAMIRPTNYALVGRLFSVQERPKFVSYNIIGIASAYLIGSTITGVIGDWRLVFLLFVLPTALLSFVLVMTSIPTADTKTVHQALPQQEYWHAYRVVLSNKSALACLIGNVCAIITQNVVLVSYVASFLRHTYLVDAAYVSVIFSSMAVITIIGSLIGGRIAHRMGRRRLTVFTAVLIGGAAITFMNVANLGGSLACLALGGFAIGIKNTTYNSLALEQIPEYRGTMMSLSEVSRYVAQSIGNGIGGVILLTSTYQVLGLALGTLAIIAAMIFQFFTRDPTKGSDTP